MHNEESWFTSCLRQDRDKESQLLNPYVAKEPASVLARYLQVASHCHLLLANITRSNLLGKRCFVYQTLNPKQLHHSKKIISRFQ